MTAIEIVKAVNALLEKNLPVTEEESKTVDAARDALLSQNGISLDAYYEAVNAFYGAEMDEAIKAIEASL